MFSRSLKSYFQSFEIDPRSLLGFRIILALTLIWDLSERFALAPYFYSDSGALPIEVWSQISASKKHLWSLHLLSANDWFVHALILFQIALAVCIGIGYRARLASFLSWILIISLNFRNPGITYGGDKLAGILLFFSILMPYKNSLCEKTSKFSWPLGFAMTIQLMMLYVSAGIAKYGESAWTDGTAIFNALQFNMMVKPFGRWLYQFEDWLHFPTIFTPWFEILAPILLFIPFCSRSIRLIGILLFASMHLFIYLAWDVGFFSMYSFAALCCIIPSFVWERLEKLSFISTIVRFRHNVLEVLSGRKLEPYSAPTANTKIIATTSIGLLLYFFISFPSFIHFHTPKPFTYPIWLWTAVNGANMFQNWDVFRNPSTTARWYVSKGILNGTKETVDTFQGLGTLKFKKHEEPNALFKSNFRWRLLLVNSSKYVKYKGTGNNVASALRQKWNHDNSHKIEKVETYKLTKKPGQNRKYFIIGYTPSNKTKPHPKK